MTSPDIEKYFTEPATAEQETPTIAKAVIAGVTALSGALLTALADNGVTATEWVSVAATTVVAVAAVWATSNKRV